MPADLDGLAAALLEKEILDEPEIRQATGHRHRGAKTVALRSWPSRTMRVIAPRKTPIQGNNPMSTASSPRKTDVRDPLA